MVLAHTALAGDWAIFKEVPQEELEEISALLDRHCEASAKTWGQYFAAPSGPPGDDEFRRELRAKFFEVCREAAAHSALQYGAAVNRARSSQ